MIYPVFRRIIPFFQRKFRQRNLGFRIRSSLHCSMLKLQCLPKALGIPIHFKIFQLFSLSCVSNGSTIPLPPSYNIDVLAKTLSYVKMHYFYLQNYSYLLHTTLLYGVGNLVACLKYSKYSKILVRHCTNQCK